MNQLNGEGGAAIQGQRCIIVMKVQTMTNPRVRSVEMFAESMRWRAGGLQTRPGGPE